MEGTNGVEATPEVKRTAAPEETAGAAALF